MKITLSVGMAALCSFSFAQFSDNFESETGSAGGTVASGQNGWTVPAGVDMNIYTYSGNSLGFATNPNGNNQFLGGSSQGGTLLARAQHDVTFSGGVWRFAFDFVGGFNGTLPTADNLGSFSLQPSTTNNIFQTLYAWGTNTSTATAFNANVGHFTATGQTGGGAGIVFDSPGADWTNLPVNHWFHQTVTVDFGTNSIIDTTLQDLTAGGSSHDFQPTGWYLAGGQNNTQGLSAATAVRFFAGGNPGNIMGYDNFSASPVPEPGTVAALSLGVIAFLRRRRKA